MAAAQDGDKVAYARLLADVTPFVRVLVRRRCADADRAEEWCRTCCSPCTGCVTPTIQRGRSRRGWRL